MFYLCNNGGNLEDVQITRSNWGSTHGNQYGGVQSKGEYKSSYTKSYTVCDSSGKAGQVYMIFWIFTSTDGQQGWGKDYGGGSWSAYSNCEVLRSKTIFNNDNGENVEGAYGKYARNSLQVTFVKILNDGAATITRKGFATTYGQFRFYSSLLSFVE